VLSDKLEDIFLADWSLEHELKPNSTRTIKRVRKEVFIFNSLRMLVILIMNVNELSLVFVNSKVEKNLKIL
jgi:hypothetical protein